MKVEKAGIAFEPIQITLETEDEAKKMWCALHELEAEDVQKCAEEKDFKVGSLEMWGMWKAFDNVFDPRGDS